MAEAGQTYQSHTRFFPPYHFFVVPVLMLNVLYAVYMAIRTPALSTAWGILVAAAILGAALFARTMTLAVQDRVIRLEMRLRLRGLLPPDLHPRIDELTRGQLIALRFASDAELVDLVRDIIAGKLSDQKDIKMRIKNWQGDYLRA
jgi:hypothetical protein